MQSRTRLLSAMPLALGVALAFNAAAMAGDLPKRSRSYCDALRIGITLSAAAPATCAAHASRAAACSLAKSWRWETAATPSSFAGWCASSLSTTMLSKPGWARVETPERRRSCVRHSGSGCGLRFTLAAVSAPALTIERREVSCDTGSIAPLP